MTKTPRFKRRPKAVGSIQLQERDAEIVRLVYEYRFLNSGHFQALVEGSDQVILRRLQKLFHHRYLDRPVSQVIFSNAILGHQKMVYGLGRRGADLLAERFGMDRGKITWKRKDDEVKERYIQHTLMISDFRACLTLALSDTSGADLSFWRRENPRELKDYVYIKEGGRERRLTVVPDGFFGVEDAGGRMYFFLEADRSTMSNTRFKSKMRAYWLWWHQGGSRKRLGVENFRVLTLTLTKRRRDNLVKAVQGAVEERRDLYMFWFACVEDFDIERPRTVLQNIWKTAIAGDQELHSLLE